MSNILIQPSAAAGFASLFGQVGKGSGDTVNIPEGMLNIGGNSRGYMLAAQTDWDPTTHDDGTVSGLSLGDDIYIYAVQPASGAYADVIASKNSTTPTGYTAGNSRKLGGCHVGRVRPISKRYDAAFTPAVQIVPNACWDLQHRPKCDPSGMVEVVPGALWVDIYLNSEGAGTWPENVPVSAYNAAPIKDDVYARIDFGLLARNAGKRLPTVAEFLVYAEGAPQGGETDNNTAWSSKNNSGPAGAGSVAKAISMFNVTDVAGNLWDWLDETYDLGLKNTYGWRSDVADVGKDATFGRGDMHTYNDSANSGKLDGNEGHSTWRSFIGGGQFVNGAHCGSRAMRSSANSWVAVGDVGVRCVCDAL